MKRAICLFILLSSLWMLGCNRDAEMLRDTRKRNLRLSQENSRLKVKIEELETGRQNQFDLLIGRVDIRFKTYYCYPFQVSKDMDNVRIQGGFEVDRGSGVEMHIFDSDGFRNWKDLAKFDTLYSSDRRASWTLESPIPIEKAGQYYIVFDDNFFWISDKPGRSFMRNFTALLKPVTVNASLKLYFD